MRRDSIIAEGLGIMKLRVTKESYAHLKIQVLSVFKEDFFPKLLSGRLSLACEQVPLVLNRD